MKKTILTLFVGFLVTNLFSQSIPANPLYEYASIGGFTSLRNSDTVTAVSKLYSTSIGRPLLTEDRFGNSVGAVELGNSKFIRAEGTGLDFGTGSNKGFAVSVWMKPTTNNRNYFLFSKARTNWTGSNDFDYGIAYNTTDGLVFISGTSADTGNYVLTNVRPVVNEWNHLVMTLDQTGPTSGTKRVYVNGVKIFDGVYSTKGIARPGSDLYFGRSKDASYFSGSIDDFYLYDRPLTDLDVQNLYNAVEVDYTSYPTLDLKFNGNDVDSSLFLNDVESVSVSYVNDRFGNEESALYIDKNENFPFQVLNQNSIDFGTGDDVNFTLSFWFKDDLTTANSNLGFSLLTKAKNFWSGSNDFDYGVSIGTQNELIAFTGPSSDAVNYPTNIITTSDTLWHHLAITCEQTGVTTGNKRVYFDGVEVLNDTYSSKGVARNSNLIFGRGKAGIARYEGSFDDVLIYKKSLTPAEVADLYTPGMITSITSIEKHEALSIYPNPASNVINTGIGQLEIFDALGNTTLSNESTGQVDVSNLVPGIYFVTQNGKRTKLIIE